MSEKFVTAYSKVTGEKHRVPAHWLDHPRLGKGLRKTPLPKAADSKQAAKPDQTPPAGDNKKGK